MKISVTQRHVDVAWKKVLEEPYFNGPADCPLALAITEQGFQSVEAVGTGYFSAKGQQTIGMPEEALAFMKAFDRVRHQFENDQRKFVKPLGAPESPMLSVEFELPWELPQ